MGYRRYEKKTLRRMTPAQRTLAKLQMDLASTTAKIEKLVETIGDIEEQVMQDIKTSRLIGKQISPDGTVIVVPPCTPDKHTCWKCGITWKGESYEYPAEEREDLRRPV